MMNEVDDDNFDWFKRFNCNSIFRFANWYDKILIFTGIAFIIISGTTIPLMYLVYGKAVTEFTSHAVAVSVLKLTSTMSLNSSSIDLSSNYNQSNYNQSNYGQSNYFCNYTAENTLKDYFNDDDPDELLRRHILYNLLYIIGLCLTLVTFKSLAYLLWSMSVQRQIMKIRIAFLRAVLSQSIPYYDVNPPQLLLTRFIDDIQKIENAIEINVIILIEQTVSLIVAFIIAISLSWKLTLAICALIPFLLLGIVVTARIISAASSREQSILAKAGEIAESAISAIMTVVAFGGEKEEEKRYTSALKQVNYFSIINHAVYGLLYGLSCFVIFTIYGIGFWYGGSLLLDCEITSGTILTVLFEIIGVLYNLNEALPLFAVIATANGAKQYVYSVIDQNQSDQSTSNKATLQNIINGRIEFSDVLFHYPSRPDVPILKGFDLVIKEGQTVALVGPSGSGKSTVLKVLQQIYIHNGGRITIDGVDVKELDINWLHNQIGIVSQEPVLFNMSISENIGLGKEGATRDEIVEAARAANAYEFIAFLPNGFDTIVGNGGTQLSGGQKQRIAIARALIRNPKILLLDEATSALDTESEKVVQKSLNMAREGRTTIIIAHRLSTIQEADLIVVIDDGRVVELGTHLELIEKEGIYRNLIQYQLIDNKSNEQEFKNACKWSLSQRKHQFKNKSSFSQLDIKYDETDMFVPITTRRSIHSKSLPRKISEAILSDTIKPVSEAHQPFIPNDNVKRRAILDDIKTSFKLRMPDIWYLLAGMSGFILTGVLFAYISVFISDVVEAYTETDKDLIMENMRKYFFIFFGIGLLSILVLSISVLFLNLASDRLTTRLRQRMFSSILKQDMSFFDDNQYSSNILIQRLTVDISIINQGNNSVIGKIVKGGVSIIAGYIIALEAFWSLGLISLSSVIVIVIAVMSQIYITKLNARHQENQKLRNKTALETIENVFTITSLGIKTVVIKNYTKKLQSSYWESVGNIVLQGILLSSVQSALYALSAALMYIGAVIYTSSQEYAGINGIIRASGSMLYTTIIFMGMLRLFPYILKSRETIGNVLDIVYKEPNISNTEHEGDNTKPLSIELSNVDFTYPSRPQVQVLNQLNIYIKSGKTIALVGPSGSGKSTVISLIERFYDPNIGAVFLNDDITSNLDITWLRRQISLVSQEPVLFDMSISDNIRYGALFRDVTDDEVIEAAKLANIHNFIVTLPQGYDTYVGNKGTQLSGGQKQRIAIARALIRNPKILLLDEATSALDTESEKIVQQSLDVARQGRTTIVIAHRLSTIVNSDNIIVLHKGSVKEQGTHSELMKKRGAYFFMHNLI